MYFFRSLSTSYAGASLLFLLFALLTFVSCIHAAIARGSDIAANAHVARADVVGVDHVEVPEIPEVPEAPEGGSDGGDDDPYGGSSEPAGGGNDDTPPPVDPGGPQLTYPGSDAGIPQGSTSDEDSVMQTPFTDKSLEEALDFFNDVLDFVQSASSLLSMITSSPSSTSAPAAVRARATHSLHLRAFNSTTTTSVATPSGPSLDLDPTSACAILSGLSAACATVSPTAWGSFDMSALPTDFLSVASIAPTYTAAPSTTTDTLPPSANPSLQASCACYSSSWFVPEVWNTAASVCGTGVAAQERGLCWGKSANVRGLEQRTFNQPDPTSTAGGNSALTGAAAAVTRLGIQSERWVNVVVAVVLVAVV
ncbi:MAG: hypothetical protein M1822_009516 [Bathelium mastoideum]|nr:MAG: hypothetical protein M1822_009516 [Bathelium mastoideum]